MLAPDQYSIALLLLFILPVETDITSMTNELTVENTDDAKQAARRLDVISETKNVASVLSIFINKRGDELTKSDVQDLEILITALNLIYDEGRYYTTKVSIVPYLLRSYNRYASDRREKEPPLPNTRDINRVPESMWRVQQFVEKCKNNMRGLVAVPITPSHVPLDRSAKKPRHSPRWVTPEKPDPVFSDDFLQWISLIA